MDWLLNQTPLETILDIVGIHPTEMRPSPKLAEISLCPDVKGHTRLIWRFEDYEIDVVINDPLKDPTTGGIYMPPIRFVLYRIEWKRSHFTTTVYSSSLIFDKLFIMNQFSIMDDFIRISKTIRFMLNSLNNKTIKIR